MHLHQSPSFLLVVTFLAFIAAFSESILPSARAATYRISQDIKGQEFFRAFDIKKMNDPTHGHVEYVDEAEARDLTLVESQSDNRFILRADNNTVPESGKGRKSVRMESKKSYTTHVSLFNIRHIPQGCGTWPAVWTVGSIWPGNGEIDIVEGINDKGPNASTLHTAKGCNMPQITSKDDMLGSQRSTSCASSNGDNSGCGVEYPNANSYGPEFNQNGGGWYAMERSQSHIKIWFWGRQDSGIPDQILNPGGSVDPDSWGPPTAFFPSTQCNMKDHFKAHKIIINLTFCGDWGGPAFNANGCSGKCEDYVTNNPSAFTNAYFEFISIRLYSP